MFQTAGILHEVKKRIVINTVFQHAVILVLERTFLTSKCDLVYIIHLPLTIHFLIHTVIINSVAQY